MKLGFPRPKFDAESESGPQNYDFQSQFWLIANLPIWQFARVEVKNRNFVGQIRIQHRISTQEFGEFSNL